MNRLLSLSLKWSVQAVLYTRTITVLKVKEQKTKTDLNSSRFGVGGFGGSGGSEEHGKIVVYRDYFKRLLAFPKPLRDQLVLEGSILQALRSGEVSSLKVEYVDFERGDLFILDSKKKCLLPRPLNPTFADHLDKYMQEMKIIHGIIIHSLPKASRQTHRPGSSTKGEGLSIVQINRIWYHYCEEINVPAMPSRMGRAYWACYEHFVLGKPIAYIQWFLRHDDLQSTQHYLYEKIIDYQSMKAKFFEDKKPFLNSSVCGHFDGCLGAEQNCHCRMFTSKIEVKK